MITVIGETSGISYITNEKCRNFYFGKSLYYRWQRLPYNFRKIYQFWFHSCYSFKLQTTSNRDNYIITKLYLIYFFNFLKFSPWWVTLIIIIQILLQFKKKISKKFIFLFLTKQIILCSKNYSLQKLLCIFDILIATWSNNLTWILWIRYYRTLRQNVGQD